MRKKVRLVHRPIELGFCPTGSGGGVDNSCSNKGSGGGSSSSSDVSGYADEKFQATAEALTYKALTGASLDMDMEVEDTSRENTLAIASDMLDYDGKLAEHYGAGSSDYDRDKATDDVAKYVEVWLQNMQDKQDDF